MDTKVLKKSSGCVLAAFTLSFSATAIADETITENVKLTADADWRSKGKVTINSGVTVDLNGYTLKVRGLDCNDTIVDTVETVKGYRFLDYIESSHTELINTEFVPTSQTGVDMEFAIFDGSNIDHSVFGAAWAGSGYFLYLNGNCSFYGNGELLGVGLTANTRYRFETLPGETPSVMLHNSEKGWLLGSANATIPDTSQPMTIFGCTRSYGAIRLYSFKMTENGALVRDLVPAERMSDGKPGLYDRVSGGFYVNVGTGEFAKGEVATRLFLDLSDGASYSFDGRCEVPTAVTDSELSQACDLRALGQVKIDGTVALNGNRLQVAGTTGKGSVVNQSGRYLYKHYRFKVDAVGSGNCLAFSDLRLFSFDENVTGLRSGESAGVYGYDANSSYLAALDGSVDNKWCVEGGGNSLDFRNTWIQVDYAEPIQITKYEWWSTNDGAQRERAPVKWRFQGSNDGVTWTDIDAVSRNYEDNPATSKTLAYTFDTGFTLIDTAGEFQVDVPEGVVATNTLKTSGNVKLTKDGGGMLVETRSAQAHEAGEVVVAGTLAYEPQNYVTPGDLTLAGGTLAVKDGNAPTVGGVFSVTASSQIKLLTDSPTGNKRLVAQVGAEFDPKYLTVILEPEPALAVPYSLNVQDGNLLVFFGDPNEVATAYWTGAIDGDVTKSGNWRCLNGSGAELKDRLPGEHTSIQLSGDVNIQIPVGTQLAYREFVIGDCRLTANVDWRGLYAPINGTVNLDGYTLQLARFSGSGKLTQPVEGKYKSYRFKVDAVGDIRCNVLAFSDLRLFSFGVNVAVPELRSAASAGVYGHDGNSSYLAVLDGNAANKWCVVGPNFNDTWVRVDYAEPIQITRYEWWSTDDGEQRERAPREWRFQGSNDDGATWTDLDVVSRAFDENPAASQTLAYRKFFSPVGQAAELCVDVPSGEIENSSLAIDGNIRLVKVGAGTFVPKKAGQTYQGGTLVAEGTIKIGANEFGVLGSDNATLSVADGAQLLDPMAANNAVEFLRLELEGVGPDGTGAYRVTTHKDWAMRSAWLAGLTLTGDALFGREDYGFNLIANEHCAVPLRLNGHTLTYRSPKATGQNAPHLAIANVQGEGPGTLVISDNVLLYPITQVRSELRDPKRTTPASVLSEVTLVIEPNASYCTGDDDAGEDLTVSNLIYRSASPNSQTKRTTTVLGGYTLASATSEPKVTLGDAEHLSTVLDLGGRNAAAERVTFAEGSTVLVKVGSRKVYSGDLLVAWDSKPANVKFVLDRPGALLVTDHGLMFRTGLSIIIR